MNIWTISTFGLAVGVCVVAGRNTITPASAATADAPRPSIGFEWREEQPHMEAALHDLRAARHSLEVAAENKGGWRALALKHTDEAIAETIRGMEYAKAHPKE